MSKINFREIKGYKYELVSFYCIQTAILPAAKIETEFICLGISGNLTIAARYAWDGASGPTVDTKSLIRGTLVHDALYQLIRDGHLDRRYKSRADKLFYQIIIEDDMSRFRAWYVWKAVVWFGSTALIPPSLLQETEDDEE